MPNVPVYNDNVEKALRKLKKKVNADGLIEEVRRRQEFKKPSEIKRKNHMAAKARQRKRLQKEQLPPKLY